MVAQDFERAEEAPSVRMKLARSNVQLSKELLHKEGEGSAEAQPLKDRRVDECEGHPIGGPIIYADRHAWGGDAHAQVAVFFSIDGA